MTPLGVEELLSVLRAKEKEYIAALAVSEQLEQLAPGSYYLTRLQRETLVSIPEWEVLKYVLANFPPTTHIVEIGCGWGQVLAMAAAAGYTCTGLDVYGPRLEGANFLRHMVDADFQGVRDRLHYVQANFPSNWKGALGPSVKSAHPVIGFFSNLGMDKPESFREQCIVEMHHFDFVVMDVVNFFCRSGFDIEAQQTLIEKMDRSGIKFTKEISAGIPGAYRYIGLVVSDPRPFHPSQ